jgi:NAD(P)-dependent dehydrogenase (short-subunit alcohol dehydrogenase family)
MIEVQLVNSVAPLFCNRLSEVMKKDNTGKNTSSMFLLWKASLPRFQGRPTSAYQYGKAALNMLTHTAAGTLAKTEFYECSEGWVTTTKILQV